MRFAADTVRPLWQSSNLEKPNCEFLFSDFDGDKKPELIVIEGEYDDKYICRGEYLALWRWNGWGFANEWRGAAGRFAKLKLAEDGRSFSVTTKN
ncbi:MAG: hypothetical protein PHS62_00165 [Patescibacteria group bacterium]|nr:hypothetical protein [Patescibacteria group bacterium]